MAIDVTRLLEKIVPEDDGTPPVHLRKGTITALNSNGTVDVTMSGVSVPGLAALLDMEVAVGTVVQVLVYRGGALVLGPVRTGLPSEVAASVVINAGGSVVASQVVTYPALGGTGTILAMVTVNSSLPGTVIEVSASSVTSTQSQINIYRTGSTVATTIYYLIRRPTPT